MSKRLNRKRAYDRLGLLVVSHRQEFLEECLDSVRAQSVPPADVIVVDNGSPADATVRDMARDMGFETVRIDVPRGVSVARNVGCELLAGCDVLVSLDGDDLLLPTYIETYLAAAKAHNADVVFGAAELFGARTGIAFTAEERLRHSDLRGGNFVPANTLFRRELWRCAGGYDPALSTFEDWDFWLSCAELGAVFHAVDEPLWRYRRHAVSSMSTVSKADKDVARRYVREKHLRYIRGPMQWRRVKRKMEKVLKREGS